MPALVPLLVVVPLLVGALLGASGSWLPRGAPDTCAILAAAATTVISALVLVRSLDHDVVYWLGGWKPERGLALGISLVVDPIGAAIAVLVSALVLASLIFSWRYFEEVGHAYHSLVLALLAGMLGFSLSGDLFNLVVWMELMSVSAYALCGYQVHQAAVIQGAVNFAIINTLGTLSMLMGVALVYGATGELNLSAIGHQVSAHGSDGPVVVGFTLVTVGLLVKAGAVPFHFWLSDAYAVASAPVGALFAGAMSDLAYHVFARVYWDGFAEGLAAHADAVRQVLLVVAALTAVVGAVMCWLQADLKRQLAFLTISHGGGFLAGIALLTPLGLAGATLYLVTDGALKAALFLALAIIVLRLGGSDELALRGRGRDRRFLLPGVLGGLVGLGLAGVPPFGTFLSLSQIYDSGPTWLSVVLAAAAAVTAATVLRAAGRVFLGWGPAADPYLTDERAAEPDEGEPDDRTTLGLGARTVLLAPAALLVAIGLGLSFVPGVVGELVGAAHAAEDPAARQALVLHDRSSPPGPRPAYRPSDAAWTYGVGAGVATVLLAGWGLRRRPRTGAGRALPAVRGLKAVHDGAVGDYAVWFTAGAGVLGAVWVVTLR